MVCSSEDKEKYDYTVKISLGFSENTNLEYNNQIDDEGNFVDMRSIIEGIQDAFDMTPIFTDYEICGDIFLNEKNLERKNWGHIYSKPLTDKINIAREYEESGDSLLSPILYMTIEVFCNIIEEPFEFNTFAGIVSRFDRLLDFRLKKTGKFGTNNRAKCLIYDNNAPDNKYSTNAFSLSDIRGATRFYTYLYDRENMSNTWDLSQKCNWPVVANILEGIDLRKVVNRRIEDLQRKYCVDIDLTACADYQLRHTIEEHMDVSDDRRRRIPVLLAFTID